MKSKILELENRTVKIQTPQNVLLIADKLLESPKPEFTNSESYALFKARETARKQIANSKPAMTEVEWEAIASESLEYLSLD